MDSASIAAKKGGAATGPNPTVRVKAETKRYLLTDDTRRMPTQCFDLVGAIN